MVELDRITFDPAVMGGRACIRGMRVTAGMIVGLVASLASLNHHRRTAESTILQKAPLPLD